MIRIMPASKYYIWCIAYATKQHVAQFVDNSCINEGKMWYFLSFKNNAIIFSLTRKYLNIASTPFISFAFVVFRFIPIFRQVIVLPALQNLTGQTPKAPIRGNGKGLSGAIKGRWQCVAHY